MVGSKEGCLGSIMLVFWPKTQKCLILVFSTGFLGVVEHTVSCGSMATKLPPNCHLAYHCGYGLIVPNREFSVKR